MNKITIFTDKIKVNKGKLTAVGEKQLVALLEAQAKLEEILEDVKYQLGLEMEKTNTDFIESEDVKVTRNITGRKFAFDPKNKVDAQFTQTVSYPQVNSKAVDAYLTLNGKLPEGILENARKIKVNIELIS